MHPNNRNRIWLSTATCLLVAVVCFGVLPHAGNAVTFEELRTSYFLDRSVTYAKELLLKEEYVSVLYKCTADELKLRKSEGIDLSSLVNQFDDLEPILFQVS